MLFDDKAQPRANMEQASLEFVVYTLRPWLVRFEQTIARDLLLPTERGRYFAERSPSSSWSPGCRPCERWRGCSGASPARGPRG